MNNEIVQFFESVQKHKKYVLQAGIMVGGISDERLFNHDASKFLVAEFPHYARNFHGDKADPEGFGRALEHHWRCNDHHWQYWVREGVPTIMLEESVREMVADWMAASLQYTNSWNMTRWLDEHLDLGNLEASRIKIHTGTAEILYDILYDVGYRKTDNSPKVALLDWSRYQEG